MSQPDAGKYSPSNTLPASTQNGQEDLYSIGRSEPHLKSICFILNWYLGPWLQLTDTTVTAIEISRLKIDVLGVSQSLFRISHPSS